MALFEIFIPASNPDGFNVTAKVRADSWVQALRHGLARLGDTADIRNVIADITENGIEVTEPHSGRVFRIKEIEDHASAPVPSPTASSIGSAAVSGSSAPSPASPAAGRPAQAVPGDPVALPAGTPAVLPAQAVPAAAAWRPPQAAPSAPTSAVPPAAAGAPPAAKVAVSPAPQTTSASAHPAAAAPPAAAPVRKAAPPPATRGAPPAAVRPAGPRVAPAPVAPSGPRFVSQAKEEGVTQERAVASAAPIGRAKESAGQSSAEDIIGQLFDETQKLYDQGDAKGAANFILDLAMRCVQADSGAVFVADINASDLYFAAARGPKAQEAMKFRVQMGQGIVGFCAQEGVALAVSDVQRDPRFYANISKSIGYQTTSILCAPAEIDGRVYGALELINKREGNAFNAREMSVLNFLAHEYADYLVNTGQTGD